MSGLWLAGLNVACPVDIRTTRGINYCLGRVQRRDASRLFLVEKPKTTMRGKNHIGKS